MILHRNIKLLSWFNFLLDFRFYAPLAIIYFAQVSGSYALGMSIFSITMITSAVFEVPTGIYSDLIGRKKTMVWGALATFLSVTFYALANTYSVLVIGALLEGLARAFYSGNHEAFLHDTLAETGQEEEYSEYYGQTSSMFQWALALSSLAGGFLASFSFALVMWLSVIPALLGLYLTMLMTEPKVHKEETTNVYAHLKEALTLFKKNQKLRTLSLAKIISYAQGESGYLFQSAFVNTLWPLWAIGVAKTLSNIGAALSFHFSGRLIKRYEPLKLLLTGKLYSIITNIVSLVFPTVLSPLLMSSTSLLYGTSAVANSDLMQREYSQKQRSTMGSLNELFGSIAFAIVSISVGLVADQIGPAKALLLLQILATISLILIWSLFHKRSR